MSNSAIQQFSNSAIQQFSNSAIQQFSNSAYNFNSLKYFIHAEHCADFSSTLSNNFFNRTIRSVADTNASMVGAHALYNAIPKSVADIRDSVRGTLETAADALFSKIGALSSCNGGIDTANGALFTQKQHFLIKNP